MNPKMLKLSKPDNVRAFLLPQALARWDVGIRAESDDDHTIDILGVIGEDWWDDNAVTAAGITQALRRAGGADVVLNINSPGGSMFDGIAIYNALRQYEGHVTARVLGMAASAASTIALAADRVEMGEGAFFFIHNPLTIAIGDYQDMQAAAAELKTFAEAMVDVYVARSGADAEEIQRLMDAETWLNAKQSQELGFADADEVSARIVQAPGAQVPAVRRMESMLRKAGASRAQAAQMISEFKSSVRDAVGGAERDAARRSQRDAAALEETATLVASLKSVF